MKNKITTMRSRPEVSEKEIQQHMNFDRLLLEKDTYLKKQKNIRIIRNLTLGTGAAAIIALAIFSYLPEVNGVEVQPPPQQSASELPPGDNVVLLDSSSGNPDIKIPDKSVEQDIEKKIAKETRSLDRDELVKKNEPPKTAPAPEEKTAHRVYNQAAPAAGYPELYAYFERELTYPEDAVKDSIAGIVTVAFTINEEGQPGNIQIENSLGSAFDTEVFRVIQNMPAWVPASYDGKPVKSKVSIPLTFEIQKHNDKQ